MQIKKEAKVNSNIVKILSLLIVLSAFIVILGRIFNVLVLRYFLPNAQGMSLITAISFVLTAGIIYYLNEHQKGNIFTASVIVPFFTSMILLLMLYHLVSDLTGLHPLLDELFIGHNEEIVYIPSLLTLFNFLLISLAAMMCIFNKPGYKRGFKIIGAIIVLTGLTAVLGYIFNQSAMYYLIEDNNGMAIQTASLFIITGISLILLRKY